MAAPNNKVKINEVIKIAPFPDPTTAFTVPFTYYDTFWFRFPPIQRLFFYQINDLTPDLFNSIILPRLNHSLSLTLTHYLPIAGNIMWPEDAPKPAIYYSPNDGVSVTVAESSADFNYLSSYGIRAAVEFHPLVPHLPISDDKAEIITIQVTLFPNEGFSIGYSFHHAVLDGRSSTLFRKSWAYLCRQLDQEENPSLSPELTPSFDRTVIEDPNGLDMVYVNHWLAFMGSADSRSLKVLPIPKVASNLVRATFELTREDIKKLRDKIISMIDKVNENEIRRSRDVHFSTFVISCSYAYVCLVKAQGVEDTRTVTFGVAADCRSRLDPPIPMNYFGNCIGGLGAVAKASDFTQEDGVAFVAEKLSDLIKGLRGDVVKGSEETIVSVLTLMMKETGLVLSVAGSPRFDVYESDFGWGRPRKAEVVSIDSTGAISLAESRDHGGGIEVDVVLEKQQMEVFASLFVDGLKP